MKENIYWASALASDTGASLQVESDATLLRQNNGDPKIVQGLLRHNSIKVTMDLYDEAMSDEKQMAHRKVLRLVTRKQDRTVMRTASGTGIPAST
jgi:hypothetical protein